MICVCSNCHTDIRVYSNCMYPPNIICYNCSVEMTYLHPDGYDDWSKVLSKTNSEGEE